MSGAPVGVPEPFLVLARALQERLAKGQIVVPSLIKVMDGIDPDWRTR